MLSAPASRICRLLAAILFLASSLYAQQIGIPAGSTHNPGDVWSVDSSGHAQWVPNGASAIPSSTVAWAFVAFAVAWLATHCDRRGDSDGLHGWVGHGQSGLHL